MTQERVGSVVFYLDRDLRSQLHLGQIANQDIDDPLPSPALDTKEWIVIPERHPLAALNDYDLSRLPYERTGRFRLYRRSDLEPRVLVGRAEGPLPGTAGERTSGAVFSQRGAVPDAKKGSTMAGSRVENRQKRPS